MTNSDLFVRVLMTMMMVMLILMIMMMIMIAMIIIVRLVTPSKEKAAAYEKQAQCLKCPVGPWAVIRRRISNSVLFAMMIMVIMICIIMMMIIIILIMTIMIGMIIIIMLMMKFMVVIRSRITNSALFATNSLPVDRRAILMNSDQLN